MSRMNVRSLLLLVTLLSISSSAAASADYGRDVGTKLGSSVTNILLGWVEIPKNVIATSNQVNVLFGMGGGMMKGVLHAVGRTLTGVVDLISLPLPTQPIAEPQFVWEHFDEETHYNPVFKLKD